MRRALGLLVAASLVVGCGTTAREVALDTGDRPAAVGTNTGRLTQTPSFAGIYPFTTRAELDAYAAGPDQTYRDPVRTARDFAVRYLGFATPELVDEGFQAGGSADGEVPLGVRVGGQFFLVTTVVVRQLGPQGPTGPWTVTAAANPRFQVDNPDPLQRISSPVAVSGTADAFEGTVNVEVREDGMLAGQSLGSGFVTTGGQGGQAAFSGSVAFGAPAKPGGAVLFQDKSGAGVGETDAVATTAVRVVYGPVDRTG